MGLNSIQKTDLSLSVTLCFLSTSVVGLRLYDRKSRGYRFGIDDYTIIFACAAGILWTVSTTIWISSFHLGTTGQLTQSVYHNYQINSYINRLFYAFAFDLAKLAIVLFYTKLCDKSLHRRYWYFMQFVLAFTAFKLVLHVAVLAAQCVPIQEFWDATSTRSKCLNSGQTSIIVNVFTFICEFLLVVAPIPFLWMAGLSFRQKFALCCMFNLAVLIIVASALKLRSVIRSTRISPAYELAIAHVWTTVEYNMAILVAAVLPLKARLESGFKRFKRKFSNHSAGLDVPPNIHSPVIYTGNNSSEEKTSEIPSSAGELSDRRKSQHSFASLGSRVDRDIAHLSAYEFLHEPIPEDFDVERQVYVKPIRAPLALPTKHGEPIPTFGNRSSAMPPDELHEGTELPGLKAADLKRFSAELATITSSDDITPPRHSASLPNTSILEAALHQDRRSSMVMASNNVSSRKGSTPSVRFAKCSS